VSSSRWCYRWPCVNFFIPTDAAVGKGLTTCSGRAIMLSRRPGELRSAVDFVSPEACNLQAFFIKTPRSIAVLGVQANLVRRLT
jgi:hypothetical protein